MDPGTEPHPLNETLQSGSPFPQGSAARQMERGIRMMESIHAKGREKQVMVFMGPVIRGVKEKILLAEMIFLEDGLNRFGRDLSQASSQLDGDRRHSVWREIRVFQNGLTDEFGNAHDSIRPAAGFPEVPFPGQTIRGIEEIGVREVLQIAKDGYNGNRWLWEIRQRKGTKVDLGPKRSETLGHRAPGPVEG